MLKKITLSLFFVACLAFFACEKKKSEGIAPTYGATGNPNPNSQTVTGTTTHSNPATENTSMIVGGSGWTNPTCGSTFSITLKGYNGSSDVTLSFASVIKTGNYVIAATPSGTSSCAMTIVNAPNQPAGIVWYGKSGTVAVNSSS